VDAMQLPYVQSVVGGDAPLAHQPVVGLTGRTRRRHLTALEVFQAIELMRSQSHHLTRPLFGTRRVQIGSHHLSVPSVEAPLSSLQLRRNAPDCGRTDDRQTS